jgi:hypothetical protein
MIRVRLRVYKAGDDLNGEPIKAIVYDGGMDWEDAHALGGGILSQAFDSDSADLNIVVECRRDDGGLRIAS